MLSKRTTLTVLCAAALVACDGAADSITGPPAVPDASLVPIETDFLPGIPALDPFAPMWGDGPGVAESARGGGHFQVDGALRNFAFTARTRADGTTDGQYQINNRSTGIKEHGTVSCLEVVGNAAWIGAVITSSNDPTRIGVERMIEVVDWGEGSGNRPDEASLAEVRPAASCHLRVPQELHELDGGNLQVRDAA